MFKITIISQKEGTFWLEKQTLQEVEEYQQYCMDSAHWGRPAYTEIIPEVLEIKDESGIIIQEAIPEQIIEHLAEYELIIEDITIQVNQEKINKESLAFLALTDWYAIREIETGVKMPDEIKTQRAAARASIIK